ncbi:hypothetical protein [Arthrobacter sp. UM1]|uniref:sunset domain-containing protein n=1 Tax=Arthrobacter sp. UM1 TaxID=2766776 RepID=UPI001CF660A8|nr:hypothetical protein [Arthrobacter sp. UM1]MCB4208514.1 hypothetical protein [Arthrobacter sp. UM1]
MHSIARRSVASALLAAPLLLAAAAPASAAPTVQTRVTPFSASPSTVRAGAAITVRAQTQALTAGAWRARGGTRAVVFFDPDGSAPARAVRTVTTDARGNVATGFTATASGLWYVAIPSTTALKSSVSAKAYVRVTPAPKPAPTSVRPAAGSWNCPSWAPIKGNASSRIFHRPGQRYYSRTKPEICFANPTAAIRAGYRASKV